MLIVAGVNNDIGCYVVFAYTLYDGLPTFVLVEVVGNIDVVVVVIVVLVGLLAFILLVGNASDKTLLF